VRRTQDHETVSALYHRRHTPIHDDHAEIMHRGSNDGQVEEGGMDQRNLDG